jgi:folate-binding Fe-S cluster repair protein YgfZ
MFILRSKVKIADEAMPGAVRAVGCGSPSPVWHGRRRGDRQVGDRRFVKLGKSLSEVAKASLRTAKARDAWRLQEIRAGRPWISAATRTCSCRGW